MFSWEEYIALYQQELDWLEESEKDGGNSFSGGRSSTYAEFVQRTALVLYATRCPAPAPNSKLSPSLQAFSECIAALIDGLKKGSPLLPFTQKYPKMYQNCFPVDLLLDIKDYLVKCYEVMQLSNIDEKEAEHIRHIFGEVARKHCVGCDGYYETLTRYEKIVQH